MKQKIVTTGLPTLEQAKELTSFIKRPLNNQVVLVGAVAPKINSGGVMIGKSAQEDAQKDLNRNGMLVVHSASQNTIIEPGELVLYRPETYAVFSRVITSKQVYEGLDLDEGVEIDNNIYKQYLVIVVNASELTMVLDKKIE